MEGGEALRAQKAATVASAVANSSALYRLLSLTDEAFEADPEKDAKWYDVLKIPRPDANRSMISSVKTLRQLYSRFDFLRREGASWLEKLAVRGRVLCDVCCRGNSKAGKILASTDAVRNHMGDKYHKTQLRKHDALQRRLDVERGAAGG